MNGLLILIAAKILDFIKHGLNLVEGLDISCSIIAFPHLISIPFVKILLFYLQNLNDIKLRLFFFLHQPCKVAVVDLIAGGV